jgi:probable phosphoglycerate mutase
MNTRLTLVRHGHTEWNSLGRYQGHAPIPLSEIGRAQAGYLATALAKAAPIAALYSSDLLRCCQTAGPIAAALGLEVQLDPRFREIDYGTWQGLTRGEVVELDPENYAAYIADPMKVSIPGGESQQMLAARVLAGLGEVLAAHAGEHVCIVTHGGPIREILRRFDLQARVIPVLPEPGRKANLQAALGALFDEAVEMRLHADAIQRRTAPILLIPYRQ